MNENSSCKKIPYCLFLLLAHLVVLAQGRERPLVQFSGLVLNNGDQPSVISYATILNLCARHPHFRSDYKGYFSFVVHEGDSIRFSAIGYHPQTLVVPSAVHNKSVTLSVYLKPATIQLPPISVSPWPSTEALNQAFIALNTLNDDLATVRKNLAKMNF